MPKLRLTVTEERAQKEALTRYERFLPTLTLKKLQLQVEVNRVRRERREIAQEKDAFFSRVKPWVAVLAEDAGLDGFAGRLEMKAGTANVAGVFVPVAWDVRHVPGEYGLYDTPLWVDAALEAVGSLAVLTARDRILSEEEDILSRELAYTLQRVNLFEKVKIPEARENIRKIRVYLADQQAAAVVRGKIAKAKAAAGHREGAAP